MCLHFVLGYALTIAYRVVTAHRVQRLTLLGQVILVSSSRSSSPLGYDICSPVVTVMVLHLGEDQIYKTRQTRTKKSKLIRRTREMILVIT